MKGEMADLALCTDLSKFYIHALISSCFGDKTLSDDLKSTLLSPSKS